MIPSIGPGVRFRRIRRFTTCSADMSVATFNFLPVSTPGMAERICEIVCIFVLASAALKSIIAVKNASWFSVVFKKEIVIIEINIGIVSIIVSSTSGAAIDIIAFFYASGVEGIFIFIIVP